MNINNIHYILVELISHFDNVTYLFLVSKTLHDVIIHRLKGQLKGLTYNPIDTLLCYHYMKRLNTVSTNDRFIMDYDYCCLCKKFGKMNLDQYYKFCEDCLFTCTHGLIYKMNQPSWSIGHTDDILPCGCLTTFHRRWRNFNTPYQLKCSCGLLISNMITLCQCGKIPCNRYYLDAYSESYGKGDYDTNSEYSSDSEEFMSGRATFDFSNMI